MPRSRAQTAEREFRSRFWRIIFLPVILTALLAIVFMIQTTRLLSAVRSFSASDEVLQQASYLNQLSAGSQTDLQGYLLTRDPKLLESFRNDQIKIPQTLDRLDHLSDRSPEQDERVRRLRRLVELCSTQSETLLRSTHSDAALTRAHLELTHQIRSSITDIVQHELTLRNIRVANAHDMTLQSLAFALGLTVSIGVLLSLFTRRQLIRISGTYRSAIDAALEQATGAERALHSRSEFLSIASHELKTPITALKLRLHSLDRAIHIRQMPSETLAHIEPSLHAMNRQTRRLSQLIDDILDVADIHSRRLSIDRKPVRMDEIIETVLDELADAITHSGCRIEVRTHPSAAGNWDRDRIAKALKNLIGNALKYAPRTTIEIRGEIRGDRVRIEVTDYGIGIPPQDHPRIFNLFERAVSSRHYGGLGIGLYLSRQILEAHGGSLRMRSAEGQGATFVIDLPYEPYARTSVVSVA